MLTSPNTVTERTNTILKSLVSSLMTERVYLCLVTTDAATLDLVAHAPSLCSCPSLDSWSSSLLYHHSPVVRVLHWPLPLPIAARMADPSYLPWRIMVLYSYRHTGFYDLDVPSVLHQEMKVPLLLRSTLYYSPNSLRTNVGPNDFFCKHLIFSSSCARVLAYGLVLTKGCQILADRVNSCTGAD